MENKIFVGDFETTVFAGQTYTEVWASALVPIGTENVELFGSIDDTYNFLIHQPESKIVVYYHNLKFDGSFWLDFLIRQRNFSLAFDEFSDKKEFCKNSKMRSKTVKFMISDQGQWYSITFKYNKKIIEIRDSLKLLPFSVKKIGKDFKTKHQKLDIEYIGYRYANCPISAEEAKYLKNDVLVIKEALEIMFSEGHEKITIGSCCLAEYKHNISTLEYDEMFPDLTKIPTPDESYGTDTTDAYVRKSYRGGWCYVVPGKAKKIHKNGYTYDVNSLYPSVMHSQSGSGYPTGKPYFFKGNVPDNVNLFPETFFYFLRVRCRFKIKDGFLPFVQKKGSLYYRGTESLTTSDYYNKKKNRYYRYYHDVDGSIVDTVMEFTFTEVDWQLFQDHYNIFDLEILDGVYFVKRYGIFDDYINKYKKIKMESKGAQRQIAKLFLNNLYGKMAASTASGFKICEKNDDEKVIEFSNIDANDKKPGYIPVGSAITSYARNFTIRAAQQNYYGPDQPGFIYADTDSIHADIPPDHIRGIRLDPVDFCAWKNESAWDFGFFTRQKTYVEHVTTSDGEPVKPYYDVKCAGMSEKCKKLFIHSILKDYDFAGNPEKYSDEELIFIKEKQLTVSDLDVGLCVPGKLIPKIITGGTVLTTCNFEIR